MSIFPSKWQPSNKKTAAPIPSRVVGSPNSGVSQIIGADTSPSVIPAGATASAEDQENTSDADITNADNSASRKPTEIPKESFLHKIGDFITGKQNVPTYDSGGNEIPQQKHATLLGTLAKTVPLAVLGAAGGAGVIPGLVTGLFADKAEREGEYQGALKTYDTNRREDWQQQYQQDLINAGNKREQDLADFNSKKLPIEQQNADAATYKAKHPSNKMTELETYAAAQTRLAKSAKLGLPPDPNDVSIVDAYKAVKNLQ